MWSSSIKSFLSAWMHNGLKVLRSVFFFPSDFLQFFEVKILILSYVKCYERNGPNLSCFNNMFEQVAKHIEGCLQFFIFISGSNPKLAKPHKAKCPDSVAWKYYVQSFYSCRWIIKVFIVHLFHSPFWRCSTWKLFDVKLSHLHLLDPGAFH